VLISQKNLKLNKTLVSPRMLMECLLQPIYKRTHQMQSSSDQDTTSFNNEICGANKRKQEPSTSKGNVTSKTRRHSNLTPNAQERDSRWMGLGGRWNVKQSRSRWCSPGFSRLLRRPVQFLPRDAGGSWRRRERAREGSKEFNAVWEWAPPWFLRECWCRAAPRGQLAREGTTRRPPASWALGWSSGRF